MSEIRIRAVGDRWADWDRFVAQAPDSTFAHRSEWRHIVRNVFAHDSEYVAAEDETGKWRGVLPLVHLRGLLGHYLLSMPFLNDGGPIGDEAARIHLCAHAIEVAGAVKPRAMELRVRSPVPGIQGEAPLKVAVHLRLPPTVDELWASTFKAKLRSQIRRPSKEGMTTRSGPEEIGTFYRVFCRNMRDLGTPVLPRAFFEALLSTFGPDVLFVSVYASNGAPAAAACCLRWREEMEITWASSIREFNKSAPNMLLYATAMELAIQRGVRRFNFGRSTAGAPTHRFKQQWGGADVPLPWDRWPPTQHESESSERSPLIRAATAVWQRLPLAIADWLGPRISGQLPW